MSNPVNTQPEIDAEMPTVIAPGMTINGDIDGSGELHLGGRITGKVRVTTLLVGESAEIDGAVAAEAVDVLGRITGPVEAGSVHLRATAVIDGDITYSSLKVDVGARISGRINYNDAGTAKVINIGRGDSSEPRNEAAEELLGLATRLRRATEPRSA